MAKAKEANNPGSQFEEIRDKYNTILSDLLEGKLSPKEANQAGKVVDKEAKEFYGTLKLGNQTEKLIKRMASVGRPKRTDKDNETASAAERGTKPGEKRKTYIVNEALADKIDAIAYWDRNSVKDVVNEAFTDRVAKYEKKNGPVKQVKK